MIIYIRNAIFVYLILWYIVTSLLFYISLVISRAAPHVSKSSSFYFLLSPSKSCVIKVPKLFHTAVAKLKYCRNKTKVLIPAIHGLDIPLLCSYIYRYTSRFVIKIPTSLPLGGYVAFITYVHSRISWKYDRKERFCTWGEEKNKERIKSMDSLHGRNYSVLLLRIYDWVKSVDSKYAK